MIKALYTSATGMRVQQTNVDVIANNLANVNTSGFKRSQADFQDLLYVVMQEPGAPSATGRTACPPRARLLHTPSALPHGSISLVTNMDRPGLCQLGCAVLAPLP